MKRAWRYRFAILSACLIAFAQIAVAAQPWPVEAAAHRHSALVAPASADAPEHCAGHVDGAQDSPAQQPGVPSPNLCEVHCQDAAQPDALIVAVASPVPDAWLQVRLSEPVFAPGALDAPLAAKAASPPARVLFVRFLI